MMVTIKPQGCGHIPTKRSNRIGVVRHNQLGHKPQLDSGQSSRELYDQQLYGLAERKLDWNCNRHFVCCERPCGFDLLQLHGGSDRRSRHVGRKFGIERDYVREQRIGMRYGMEFHRCLHPRHDCKSER